MRWGPPKVNPGEKYGRLLIIEFAGVSTKGQRQWLCQCDCGNKHITITANLLSRSKVKSCGCYKMERIIALGGRNKKHGMEGTPEYKAWVGMRKRCCSPNNASYASYGGRGIRVCDEWMTSFENFFRDLGPRPGPGYSLERIDVNGNYEPTNCKWATIAEQNRNRRDNLIIEFDGRRQTLSLWAAETGIGRATISWRLKNGWDVDRALTTSRYGWSKRRHG